MVEKFLDLVVQFLELFKFLCVVEPWERAIVVTMGTRVRELKPGWYWVWPFAIDTVMKESVVLDTVHLRPQSLTTKDGQSVTVGAVITYTIVDVRKTLMEVQGTTETLSDTAYGVIKAHVADAEWSDLTSEAFESKLARTIRHRAKDYGLNIARVQLSDCARMKSLRLIQG